VSSEYLRGYYLAKTGKALLTAVAWLAVQLGAAYVVGLMWQPLGKVLVFIAVGVLVRNLIGIYRGWRILMSINR
jgi:hypothetical protein